ncbi:MAG: RIO1 family regulatory kinase/ATPase [Nitrososphaerota archaeon]|nr:AarF/UbiB family protein [Candidatus Bathyarchaeota archaeon]MCX8161767.1 AarF/UbiB family protein [Candidatus Bathyarchaeota archaeon]MDW8061760.1 RIO1 family regulatory kinase/ATPase [Nitrososphaerota archaeon]
MSLRLSLKVYPRLEDEDFKVLAAIELGMSSHAYTPIDYVAKLSGLHEKELSYRLRKLNKLKVILSSRSPQPSFAINSIAYDCLALRSLVKSGVIEAIGSPLAEGKESDVYLGLSSDGAKLVLKFLRIGRISFRQTRRLRSYIEQRDHISWLYQCRLAAFKEYEAISSLYKLGIKVPKPIAYNRHLLVSSFFDGIELAFCRELEQPDKILADILDEVRRVYMEAYMIHCDLNQYNVLVSSEGDICIIDWPQYITSSHPEALNYLKRDIRNISSFFRRKYDIHLDIDRAVNYVTGLSSTL